VRLATRVRGIYVTSVREAPELIGKLLHCWDKSTNYNTLNIEKIIFSSEHADLLEDFLETDKVRDQTA